MKKIILLGLLVSITLLSCMKERDDQYNGVILDDDHTTTPCSGGTYIKIDNEIYRFLSLPPNSGIDLNNTNNSKYVRQIYVVVTWHKSDHPCKGDEIIIDAIRKK